jgi:hypothetical protein
VRPYADVDDASALYERGVAMHDHCEYAPSEELWRKAKRAPRELENP